jgi:rubrerythrin
MAKTLNDILDVAIFEEINAQKFYRIISEKVKNIHLQKFFLSLANEEYGHEWILRDMKDMKLFDGSVEIDEKSFERIEGAHIIDDAGPIEGMTIVRAMQIAMKREKKATEVYGHMAESAAHEEIMKLFIRLATDEQRHFNLINQKYKIYKGRKGFDDSVTD